MKNCLNIQFLFLLFCFCLKINAQEIQDSMRVYELKEVMVECPVVKVEVSYMSSVREVSRAAIERSMQPSLLPVLTEQVPGLFTTARGVMGYGVSGGAAGSISLRGLNGSSAQMMVLIDGHPQYAGIFGHPIADAFQTSFVEKVEVQSGPASLRFGSNAMGGVVNIQTRKMDKDGVRTDVRAGYGSYNTVETALTNQVRKGRFSSVANASYNRTDGHRDDMDFEQFSGYAKLAYDLTDFWNISADANVTHFNASCPGPVSAPLADAKQHITRGVTSFSLENHYDKTSGSLNFFYNFGKHRINDGYTPSAGQTAQDGRFRSHDDMMGISAIQMVKFFRGNATTFGFDWFRYGGKAWTDYVSGTRAGMRNNLVDKHENELAGYVNFHQRIARWLSFGVGLRADSHSQVGTEWVPQVNAKFDLSRSSELKASAAKGFRYPVLREMYMFPSQNPDLKPESMWNYEISFSQLVGKFRYGANVFFIDGKNLIQTLPNPNGAGMLNQNSGEIENAGFELQANWLIGSAWSANANYSFLHMKNPVLAAPQHKLYAEVDFIKKRWHISTGLQYIAGLFTEVGANERTENFVLWNVRVSFRVTKWFEVWARGENLLAQKYEINAGYPMPRATAMAGVNLKF